MLCVVVRSKLYTAVCSQSLMLNLDSLWPITGVDVALGGHTQIDLV